MMTETYVELLGNGPHWLFELTGELISGLVAYPVFRWVGRKVIRREHARLDAEHGVEHTEEVK